MVDRAARDELGRAIRGLAARLITNYEFEDSLSADLRQSRDLGVQSIRFAAWALYDDLREHRLEGRYAIGTAGRRRVARWILFLNLISRTSGQTSCDGEPSSSHSPTW